MAVNNYRVVTDNCVLGYFHTELSACEYIEQLSDHSPLVAEECYTEQRHDDDGTPWSEFMTASQRLTLTSAGMSEWYRTNN